MITFSCFCSPILHPTANLTNETAKLLQDLNVAQSATMFLMLVKAFISLTLHSSGQYKDLNQSKCQLKLLLNGVLGIKIKLKLAEVHTEVKSIGTETLVQLTSKGKEGLNCI